MAYAFLDIKAAYDTVDRALLWSKCLVDFGIGSGWVAVLVAMFDSNSSVVRVGPNLSRPISLERGLLQGSVLSPLLYSIFVDGLLEQLNAIHPTMIGTVPTACLAYADDIVVFARTARELQTQLDVCQGYAMGHRFAFAPRKCEILAKKPVAVSLGGVVLRQVDSFPYLGIEFKAGGLDIRRRLELCRQLLVRTAEELRPLGLNGYGFDVVTNARLVKSFVRSRVEYCLALLPLSQNQLRQLDVALLTSLRKALSIKVAGCGVIPIRALMDIESMLVRHKSLRVRWFADCRRKDETFMIYHALHWDGQNAPHAKSCFALGFEYRLFYGDLQVQVNRAFVDAGLDASRASDDQHREMWRIQSIKWRNRQKRAEVASVHGIRGIVSGVGRALAFCQLNLIDGFAIGRKIQAWLFSKCPGRAMDCPMCDMRAVHMAHLVTHFPAAESLSSTIAALASTMLLPPLQRLNCPKSLANDIRSLISEYCALWEPFVPHRVVAV